MIEGKRIAVVLPAYNAERTLEKTVAELSDLVDDRILVDDYSSDETVLIARSRGKQFEVTAASASSAQSHRGSAS